LVGDACLLEKFFNVVFEGTAGAGFSCLQDAQCCLEKVVNRAVLMPTGKAHISG